MGLKHVRCTGTSEVALEAAQGLMGGQELFERIGYNVGGLVEEKDIGQLESLGMVVEVMPDQALRIGWLESDPAAAIDALSDEDYPPDSPFASLAGAACERYVIQFMRPLTEQDRSKIAGMGIKLGGYVPDFAYKAALTTEQKAELLDKAKDIVRRVELFDARMTLRRARRPPCKLQQDAPPAAAAPVSAIAAAQLIYNIKCHDRNDLPALSALLKNDQRVHRIEVGKYRARIWTGDDAAVSKLLTDIAQLPQVSVVEAYEYPAPFAQYARRVLRLDTDAGQAVLPWTGEGQLVGVADSGVDSQHPDLKKRLRTIIERAVPEAADDPFGHGTHVCSIIAGDGTASAGRMKGVAPGAELFVQALRDEGGAFTGVPVDLGELFQEAYDAGARIHNDSWGSSVEALYTTDAFEVDQFVFEHPDFLIVLAAGNDGRQPNPLPPDDPLGRIDYNSIASPATSKNAITVGACCSLRADGPYQNTTWHDYRGQRSPQFGSVAEEPICGQDDVLAAFSSRGPTDDERIKPDLVAPGTVILAAKSGSSLPGYPEPGVFNGHYCYLSGTSMATPVVSGAAAIVRQYYVSERQHTPSAALLKATLINGCVWVPRKTVQDERVGQPNFHQGFGRLDLSRSLPVPGGNSALQFVDVDKNDAKALNSAITGKSSWRGQIKVAAGSPLSVTLCWTDYPAHGLQNHLDLIVISPANVRTDGNPQLVRGSWAKSDRFNNVERILINDPAAGVWTVMVNAKNTPFPSQGFSLVATGAGIGPFL